MAKKPSRVREQVVVYLDARDRALLEELAEDTGLSRTELFRRGLRRIAEEMLTEDEPGSSIDYLIATASQGEGPVDLSEKADDYLYGGGYEKKKRQTRSN